MARCQRRRRMSMPIGSCGGQTGKPTRARRHQERGKGKQKKALSDKQFPPWFRCFNRDSEIRLEFVGICRTKTKTVLPPPCLPAIVILAITTFRPVLLLDVVNDRGLRRT